MSTHPLKRVIKMLRIRFLIAFATGLALLSTFSCQGSFPYKIEPRPSAAEMTDNNQKSFMDPLVGGELRSLSLSGGGYRAMLFGLGAMWRLNDLGILPNLEAISSVSGGSILNAYTAIHWNELHFKNQGTVFALGADNFGDVVASPIIGLSQHTIDLRAIVLGTLVPNQSASNFVSRSLDCRLFRGAKMESFVEEQAPQFYLYATDLATGEPWVFTRTRSGFPGPGYRQVLPSRKIKVANVVAASAAFPPFLSPARFKFRGASERLRQEYPFLEKGEFVAFPPFPPQTEFLEHIDRVDLADGGLVNNLASIRCSHASRLCIISDAANGAVRQRIWPTWIGEMNPVVEAIYNQKEALLRADDSMAFPELGARRVGVQLTDDHMSLHLGDLAKSIIQFMDAALADGTYCPPHTSCADWASSIKKTWQAGYADAAVLETIETIDKHIKAAQIDTRLARVKLSDAEDIVRLGYLEADLALLEGVRSQLDALKNHPSSEAIGELILFISSTSDNWLKTPLRFPEMPQPKDTTCIWPT
jgi:predicted acylesterase/phospholipase RssA